MEVYNSIAIEIGEFRKIFLFVNKCLDAYFTEIEQFFNLFSHCKNKSHADLVWIHDRIERGRKRHKQEASPQAGWNLIFSKKAKVDKWRRLLSCLVARSMIQNGYRSSISHPHPDMDKGSRERERERDKYKARALSCSIDP